MVPITDHFTAVTAIVNTELTKLREKAYQDATRRVVEYIDAFTRGATTISPDIVHPNIQATLERSLKALRQEWAKQHGVVPTPSTMKPGKPTKTNESNTSAV